jgi:hypothetical protein
MIQEKYLLMRLGMLKTINIRYNKPQTSVVSLLVVSFIGFLQSTKPPSVVRHHFEPLDYQPCDVNNNGNDKGTEWGRARKTSAAHAERDEACKIRASLPGRSRNNSDQVIIIRHFNSSRDHRRMASFNL